MKYADVMWYLAVVAAAIMVLIVITNIFAQVLKKVVNREEFPAQAIVFFIAEVLTFVAMAIVCSIMAVKILWYFWVIAFIAGVLVAYGAIFGYDNLYSQVGTAIKSLIKAVFSREEG